jgi:CheY-like chemotaxis protein
MTRVPATILVIDDSEAMLSHIKTLLEAAGHTVIATTQTVGSARFLKGCSLVILDYYMPGIDGRQVLESLRRAAASLERAPAFYLYTSDEDIARQAKQLGFDGAFRNKGDLAQLRTQVDGALRLAALRQL